VIRPQVNMPAAGYEFCYSPELQAAAVQTVLTDLHALELL
jgi:hypothetical protein